VVSSTPRPYFTPGKDPVPILQETGLAPGQVWTGGKSRPHRDSIPDRPVPSSVAIPTELPGPRHSQYSKYKISTNLLQTAHPKAGKNKGKGESIPLQAWTGPEGSRKLRFPDFMTTAQDSGEVVSLTHRPPLPPRNAPGTHFC